VNQRDWERLVEGFDTHQLLDAVDALDEVRGDLANGDRLEPPAIRTDLLKLHALAMDVVHHGQRGQAAALFELATDLDMRVFGMIEALERIQTTLETLTDLQPEADDWDSSED
jgi:hypothetical protein